MKLKNEKYKIIAIVIVIIILILIIAVWYKNNIYPFRFAENLYKENEEHIKNIVAYFDNIDNDIYSVQMNIDGSVDIISAKGSGKIDCVSDIGYESLLFLRDRYIEDNNEQYDKQSYMLNYVKAEYDTNGNMIVKIPVYARILSAHESVDSPNRIVYYLMYCDDDYILDNLMLDSKQKNAINNDWFIFSESHTAG